MPVLVSHTSGPTTALPFFRSALPALFDATVSSSSSSRARPASAAVPAVSPHFQQQRQFTSRTAPRRANRGQSSISSLNVHSITQAHQTAGSAAGRFLDVSHKWRRPKPTRGPYAQPDLNEADRAYQTKNFEERFRHWDGFRKGQNFKRDSEKDFGKLSVGELGRLLRSAACSGDLEAIEEMFYVIGRGKKKRILDLKEPETGISAVMLAAQEDHVVKSVLEVLELVLWNLAECDRSVCIS